MLELNNHIKMQSLMSDRIWALYVSDKAAFNAAATAYFDKAYPNYRIYSFDFAKRRVWLVERS